MKTETSFQKNNKTFRAKKYMLYIMINNTPNTKIDLISNKIFFSEYKLNLNNG